MRELMATENAEGEREPTHATSRKKDTNPVKEKHHAHHEKHYVRVGQ